MSAVKGIANVEQFRVKTPGTSSRTPSRADRIRMTRAATGLKPAEKLLLRSLVDFMGNSPECWPSLRKLADEVGISVRHCRRLLRSLEQAGWIQAHHRFRADYSQTSSVFRWCKVPDTHVRPPRTSTSALEITLEKSNSNTYAATAECDLDSVKQQPVCGPAEGHSVARNNSPTPDNAPAAIPFQSCDSAIPKSRPVKPSPKFIVIAANRFLDIQEAKRVYHLAVAAKFLNAGPVDKLAFFASWCAIAAKLRAGKVHHPERMMRFLLDNRNAMSAYPDHAAETKARAAIRHLWPEKPYNPHC